MTAVPSIPQSGQSNAWLPIVEAANLTGIAIEAWKKRCTRSYARQNLARLAPPPDGQGKAVWWVHRSVHRRLATNPDHTTRDELADLSDYPQPHVELAQRRLRWVRRYEELRLSADKGTAVAQVVARVVAEAAEADPSLRCSWRSIYRWHQLYYSLAPNGKGQCPKVAGIRALVPKYTSTTDRVGDPQAGAADGKPQSRSPRAIAFFYSVYHTEKPASERLCHEITVREAARRGWAWPASPSATRKWLARYDDIAKTMLMRQGYQAWAHKFMTFIEQDHEAVAPGELYVADSHRCNFFVNHDGAAVRPWLIAFQDDNTRMIVGHQLCISGNQNTILLALRRAFLRYGICRDLKLDNGRDYAAKIFHGFTKSQCRRLRAEFGSDWRRVVQHETKQVLCDRPEWKGLLPALGVRVIFAQAYSPQSKATIERWFGTMDGRFACLLPGYCGRSVERRTEAMDAQRERPGDLLTLHQADEQFQRYLAEYHQTPHSSLNGLSPRQKWAVGEKSIQVAEEGALDLLLQVRGLRRVRANGVEVKFGNGPHRYGQYDSKLKRWKGRDVLVACDYNDPSFVICLDPESRQLICRAIKNRQVPPNTTGEVLRAASRELGRAKKEAKRAQRSAATRLKTIERIATENSRRQALASTGAATGTDDSRPHSDAPLKIVRTGFEEAAKQATRRSASTTQPAPVPDTQPPFRLEELLVPEPEPEEPSEQSSPSSDDGDYLRNDDFETELENRDGTDFAEGLLR